MSLTGSVLSTVTRKMFTLWWPCARVQGSAHIHGMEHNHNNHHNNHVFTLSSPPEQRRLLENVYAAARVRASTCPPSLDVGDWIDTLVSGTCEALWRTRRTRIDETFSIGYISRVMHGVLTSMMELAAQGRFYTRALAVSGTRKQARSEFRRQREEKVAELGRELTPREADALAESIRDGWPDRRRRPPRGFHATFSSAPIEAAENTAVPEAVAIDSDMEDMCVRLDRVSSDEERLDAAVDAWGLLVPGLSFNLDVPLARIDRLESWAGLDSSVASAVTARDGRLVEPFVRGFDEEVFDVYCGHRAYAADLFRLALASVKRLVFHAADRRRIA